MCMFYLGCLCYYITLQAYFGSNSDFETLSEVECIKIDRLTMIVSHFCAHIFNTRYSIHTNYYLRLRATATGTARHRRCGAMRRAPNATQRFRRGRASCGSLPGTRPGTRRVQTGNRAREAFWLQVLHKPRPRAQFLARNRPLRCQRERSDLVQLKTMRGFFASTERRSGNKSG